MSISKGGQSVKPYVGGKEVKEAYVGSQLVYRATPPYVYAFLGGTNDYILASWCTLSQTGAAIVKEGANFRIALSSGFNASYNPYYGAITMIIPADAGSAFSFMYKMGGSGGYPTVYIKFSDNNGQQIRVDNLSVASSWTLKNLTVPPNTYKIDIFGRNDGGVQTTYLDAIKFE